jgi:signal transduction histidine kinase
LEKIFEPLYSTKSFGVGLGLPTVRQIMEQHGGGIEIASEAGRGTDVSLWLPLTHIDERAA